MEKRPVNDFKEAKFLRVEKQIIGSHLKCVKTESEKTTHCQKEKAAILHVGNICTKYFQHTMKRKW
jgi:hypothetical protein